MPLSYSAPLRRLAATLALCALVLHPGQALAQARSPETVARQLLDRYGDATSMRASFTQTVGAQTLDGTLSVQDEAFRLDLAEQTLVTDGETLWSYSKPDRQVVVQEYDPGEVGFSVGQLFTNYLEVFRATGATRATIRGVRHDVLTLRPRERGLSVRDVTLYVRSSDGIPTRVRVHDTNGGTMAFDLSNIERDVRFPTSTFRFAAPQGTETVDLR